MYRIPVLATAVQAELQGGSPKPSGENNKDALKEEVRRVFINPVSFVKNILICLK